MSIPAKFLLLAYQRDDQLRVTERRNPVDHPHGGRSNGGGHPVSPWGTQTKGYKTRRNKRTDTMIVQRRGRK